MLSQQKSLTLTGSKGFTLIELLVVIVVIGILVALTLPNLFSAQERARDSERKNDLRNIQQQLETYYNDNNGYPDELAVLASQDYLDAVPTDPQGDAYEYAPEPAECDAGECTSYTLTAELENDNDPEADTNGNYVVNSINQ